jgi:CHAD domain-containing protein
MTRAPVPDDEKQGPAPDDEKLGPIGPPASRWERESRALLLEAFRDATADAGKAAGKAKSDLGTSVHELRKALRRAGAVLALVRPALRKDEYAAIRNELRGARRAVSSARDRTVASAALAGLPLEAEEREVADQLLAALQDEAPDAAETAAKIAEGAQQAAAQAEALDAALPAVVKWQVIARGLGGTYREARRARRDAKRSRSSFHRWRRRTKELDAQLNLISKHGGEHAAALQKAYEEISDVLGPIADLLMLRELINAHGKAWSQERFEVLAHAIERLTEEQIRGARKQAEELFAAKPKELAKRVTKAIRKDAEPLAPRVEGDDPGDSDED